MSRKWIVAAIGGSQAAGPEVEAFGKLVAHAGAILMTGGVPNQVLVVSLSALRQVAKLPADNCVTARAGIATVRRRGSKWQVQIR
jgi:hypothetical protein